MGALDDTQSSLIRLLLKDLEALAAENSELLRGSSTTRDELASRSAEFRAQALQLRTVLRELERMAHQLARSDDALRRKTEEAERARRVAEDAAQARSRFLATMSHELRTPLNAIAGYAELMQLGIHGPLTEAQERAIDRIQGNQRYLLGLINDLLSVSELEAQGAGMAIETVPVDSVLSGLRGRTAVELSARGIAYRCDRAPSNIKVRVAPERLHDVLTMLLLNAVRRCDMGSSIAITCSTEPEHVRIHVRDDAGGIAADRVPFLLEPFNHAGAVCAEDYKATGLRLALSRDMARAMGGDLLASAGPGRNDVTLTLVLQRAA